METWGPHAPRRLAWSRAQSLWVAAFVAGMSAVPVRCTGDVPPRDPTSDPRPPGTWLLYDDALEVNGAAAADFEQLPGIGPALALRLVTERGRRDGFCSLGEVAEIAGLGEPRWRAIAPRLRVQPVSRCPSSSRG